MTIKYGVVAFAFIAIITLALTSSSVYASSSSKGPTKFRQSLSVLTMGDLPDLELEQAVVEDTEEAIIGTSSSIIMMVMIAMLRPRAWRC